MDTLLREADMPLSGVPLSAVDIPPTEVDIPPNGMAIIPNGLGTASLKGMRGMNEMSGTRDMRGSWHIRLTEATLAS